MGRILSARSLVALMLGVALAAFLIAGTRYAVERKIRLERLAVAHRAAAEAHAVHAEIAKIFMEADDDPGAKERLAEEARYHRAMERKYRQAKPWEDMPPDPPSPLRMAPN